MSWKVATVRVTVLDGWRCRRVSMAGFGTMASSASDTCNACGLDDVWSTVGGGVFMLMQFSRKKPQTLCMAHVVHGARQRGRPNRRLQPWAALIPHHHGCFWPRWCGNVQPKGTIVQWIEEAVRDCRLIFQNSHQNGNTTIGKLRRDGYLKSKKVCRYGRFRESGVG